MRKSILFLRTVSIGVLWICIWVAFMAFKPDFFTLQKQRIISLATHTNNLSTDDGQWGALKWFFPEVWSVIKDNSGEIVNITIKNSPIYLPSDSLFINLVDAVPISDIAVGDTLYLNKLWPKFEALLKKWTITLEVCRSSECSNKLVLKVPEKILTWTTLPQNQELSWSTTTVAQKVPPVNIPQTPAVPEEKKFILTGYTLLWRADFRDNDDLKMTDGSIDWHYNWTLDKQVWYNPKDWVLSFVSQSDWKKYSQKVYEIEVLWTWLNIRSDMYLLNFWGKHLGIKYNYYDKNKKQAHIFINNKIHTLPNQFKDDIYYKITLELKWDNYTVSIFNEDGEKLWTGVGTSDFWDIDTLYIWSRNGLDT